MSVVNVSKWEKLADIKTVENAVSALKANGIETIVVDNGRQAKEKVLEMLPEGVEIMNMSSVTLDVIGLSKEIVESGRFNSVRNKLSAMDRKTQGAEIRKLGAAPDWVVGSVHAITEDGKVLFASASGSQLPAYSYGAGRIIWVASTKKIVKNMDEGIKRIYEHCLPLEDKRARKVYGFGSSVNKILIINKEGIPGKITLILVKEDLGF